jgi:DNA-binding XRE family transcriptional regulator
MSEIRTIRRKQIDEIKQLMDIEPKLSQSEIARRLNLNRLSVRNTMIKLENGCPLKYENKTTMRERFLD